MDVDVPWDVTWTKDFEAAVEELKSSGRWQQVKRRIEKIIRNPARTGKFKDGSLKEIRTTHLEEKVIGWQIIPGVPSHLQDKVERVILLFIVHHDEQGFGFKHTETVETSPGFEIRLPYYGGFEMQRKIHDLFQQAENVDRFRIQEPDWQDEYVIVSGSIPPDKQDLLESVLPETAEVAYEDGGLLE